MNDLIVLLHERGDPRARLPGRTRQAAGEEHVELGLEAADLGLEVMHLALEVRFGFLDHRDQPSK